MLVALTLLLTTLLTWNGWAGPIEFGEAQLERALQRRGLSRSVYPIRAEIVAGEPESYKVSEGRITGGDERGLMYGLLEAAEQFRTHGHLVNAVGFPATPVRGVRQFLHNKPGGPVDDEVGVLRVDTEDGKPKAVILGSDHGCQDR